MSGTAVASNLVELKSAEEINLLTAPYEFSVISFYKNSDAESVEFDGLMDIAKSKFDLALEARGDESRKIGWFHVDIEAHPDMAFSQDGEYD